MDHKPWFWRKKYPEKTVIQESSEPSSNRNGQSERTTEMEKLLEDLNEQLHFARVDANTKDALLAKQAKEFEEAVACWENAEKEAACLKQELQDALIQKADSDDRMIKIDMALKDCMLQVQIMKDQKGNIIRSAAIEVSTEKEKTRALEERLEDATRKLAELRLENSTLNKIIDIKEKLLLDFNHYRSQSETDFEAIVARLDSSDKNNASLKYEICMLQQELEIQNQERVLNLKSVEANHRQHLESIKKITKLERECQRLRVLVRKRFPGPVSLSMLRNEVEIVGYNSIESRRRKPSAREGIDVRVPTVANDLDKSANNVASLLDRLHVLEEENKRLVETLSRKNDELQSSLLMCARTASKLSEAESQLVELSKPQSAFELSRSIHVSSDLQLGSISEEGGSEDNFSTAESWASALISELENFKNAKPNTSSHKSAGSSDISLMDDFLEMERQALICVDIPNVTSDIISGRKNLSNVEMVSRSELLETAMSELVPLDDISDRESGELQLRKIKFERYSPWIKDILMLILEKQHTTRTSIANILEDVRVALCEEDLIIDKERSSISNPCVEKSLESSHSPSGKHNEPFGINLQQTGARNENLHSGIDKYVFRIIELSEDLVRRSMTDKDSQKLPENNVSVSPVHTFPLLSGYLAHVFLLKKSEFNLVLKHFIGVCNNLLNGRANLESLLDELNTILEWIVKHSFYFHDVSNMRRMIKKHFVGDHIGSDNEVESGTNTGLLEDKIDTSADLSKNQRSSCSVSYSNGLDILIQLAEIDSNVNDENRRLRCEITHLEYSNGDLQEKLDLACSNNTSLTNQLHESEESFSILQRQAMKLKESKETVEDQIEKQKIVNENLGSQLTVIQLELNETRHKFSSLEAELESKSICCEELEALCLELQLQLESMPVQGNMEHDKVPDKKQLGTAWEISTAAEKLVECQQTILNLGKQFKSLASPNNAALFDKFIPPHTSSVNTRRPLLLDHMRDVDGATFQELKLQPRNSVSANTGTQNVGLFYGKKIPSDDDRATTTLASIILGSGTISTPKFPNIDHPVKSRGHTDIGPLAMVPLKKNKGGVGLLKRLISRKKCESGKAPKISKVA